MISQGIRPPATTSACVRLNDRCVYKNTKKSFIHTYPSCKITTKKLHNNEWFLTIAKLTIDIFRFKQLNIKQMKSELNRPEKLEQLCRCALVALDHHSWYFQSKMISKFIISLKKYLQLVFKSSNEPKNTKRKEIISFYLLLPFFSLLI